MIEMMILAMIAAVVVKRGAEDLIHAAKGGTPQRYAAASARRKSGAAGRYWDALRDDTFEGMLRRHNRRVARRADMPAGPTLGDRWKRGSMLFRHARWNAHNRFKRLVAPLLDRWDEGWDRRDEKRRTKATRPRPGQQTVPGTVVPNAQDEDRPDPAPVPDEDETVPQDEYPDLTEDRDEDEQDEPTPGPESVPDYVPDFDATPTTEGTTTMSTVTGEVTGLDTAIRFCEDSARGYQAQIHQIEIAKASLTAAEAMAVAGPLQSAMEMTEAAASAMKQAEAELRKQIPIAELYRANPGAATKDFMLQG